MNPPENEKRLQVASGDNLEEAIAFIPAFESIGTVLQEAGREFLEPLAGKEVSKPEADQLFKELHTKLAEPLKGNDAAQMTIGLWALNASRFFYQRIFLPVEGEPEEE